MLSCPSENRLLDLIDGHASGQNREAVIAHLAQCATCRSIASSLAELAPARRASQSQATEEAPSPDPAPPMAGLQIGQRVGSYLLVHRLGAGGMGVVFEAVHERIGGRAAIKILHPRCAHDPATAERFRNEARAANLVQHPGLVHVFEMGRLPSGSEFIVMEYLAGESLGQRLKRAGALSADAAALLVRQVADALAATHDKRVIHRDLKPENIMLVPDPAVPLGERAKILDFGLAKLVPELDQEGRSSLTQSGTLLGTPLYMAPEQCQGVGKLGAAADVYSLGVVFYHLLAGHPPFMSHSLGEVMAMHLRDQPPPLPPEVPPPLAGLVTSMLAKDPASRPSMREICAHLEGRRYPGRGRAGRRWLIGALGGALLAILAVGTFYLPAPVGIQPSKRIRILGGKFLMGSSREEIDRAMAWCQKLPDQPCDIEQFEREQPQRRIGVPSFSLDQTEVTNEQFASWLDHRRGGVVSEDGTTVSEGNVLLARLDPTLEYHGIAYKGGRFTVQPGFERRPVAWVTWNAAREYCEDQHLDLPTEVQWEYAAREVPWRDRAPQCDAVVFARGAGQPCSQMGAGPVDVGSVQQDRTPEGVYDLAGNVSEWVKDPFEARYRECPEPCTDPAVPPASGKGPGVQYVFRGGDWADLAPFLRPTFRSSTTADTVKSNLGFRCAGPANYD